MQAEARKLQEAKRAWADGELDRRGAAALLDEARAEAARIKAPPLLHCHLPCVAAADVGDNRTCNQP